MIVLECKPHSSLNWDLTKITENQEIFWRFDLGLEDPYFPIDDEFYFESLALALNQFTKDVWPKFKDQTKGATFFMGNADFSQGFSWTEKQEINFASWKEENPGFNVEFSKKIFCLDTVFLYFQMLAHKLPDEMPIFLFLDAKNLGSKAERSFLLSKERLEHFEVAIKGMDESATYIWSDANHMVNAKKNSQAFCFPLKNSLNAETLKQIDSFLEKVPHPYRIVYEAFLTETWDEIDDLYVVRNLVSKQGERKLKGFAATGGQIHLL